MRLTISRETRTAVSSMRWLGDWSNENRRLTNPTVGLLCGHENNATRKLPLRNHGQRPNGRAGVGVQVRGKKPMVSSATAKRRSAERIRQRPQSCGSGDAPDKYGCPNCHGEGLDDMNCPHCGKRINVGKLLRSKRPTVAQKEAARLNGAKGGRPKAPKAKSPNIVLSDRGCDK